CRSHLALQRGGAGAQGLGGARRQGRRWAARHGTGRRARWRQGGCGAGGDRTGDGGRLTETSIVATVPGKRAASDPDLRDRLYELLEHDHLPYSVGSRFVRLIIAIIVIDVLAAILASVPEFDARLDRLFTTIEAAAVAALGLEYASRIWG